MNIKHVLVASSLILNPAALLASDFGIGVKAGTVGAGVDLSMTISEKVNVRVSLTSTDIDFDDESFTVGDAGGEAEVVADLSMDFGANALLIDWYVFDGTFHITAGMLKNNGSIDINGSINGSVTLDGQTYAVDAIQDIGGSISAGESYEPYLGIGWGRKADNDSGLSLSAELGVVLMNPKASLTATLNPTRSTAGSDGLTQTALDSDIQTAEDDINDDLSDLEMFPIISIGLNYAF